MWQPPAEINELIIEKDSAGFKGDHHGSAVATNAVLGPPFRRAMPRAQGHRKKPLSNARRRGWKWRAQG
jgi:hypothetical protein